MQIADIFVGTVCAAFGAAAIVIAATNWSPGFQFWVGRLIERRYNRAPARIVYAVVGAALIALGIAIMCGFALIDYLDLRRFFQ